MRHALLPTRWRQQNNNPALPRALSINRLGRFQCFVLTLSVEGVTAVTLSTVTLVEGGGRLWLLLGLVGCMVGVADDQIIATPLGFVIVTP